MEKNIYIINTLSNMHVGSGDVNFGVIDNLIQRDVITQLPNINSSGMKGAFREFFKNYYTEKNKVEFIKSIFGSEPRENDFEDKSDADDSEKNDSDKANDINNSKKKNKNNNNQQGAFRFFEANLLSIPVRSDSSPYFMATSVSIIKELLYKADNFDISLGDFNEVLRSLVDLEVRDNAPVVFVKDYAGSIIEEHDWKTISQENDKSTLLERFFGSPLVILSDKNLSSICDNNNLPVIARNNLENGQSQNLWYEQILPRFSKLYFTLIKEQPVKQPIEDLFKGFDDCIANNVIQIGANATIGYGYCKIKNIVNI